LSLTIDDVRRAASRLEGVAVRTPMLRCAALDDMTGAEVHLKAENLQRAGAFKFRGAYNAVASLSPAELALGVVTFSSGNHGRAIATAAALCTTTAVIVMPEDTPAEKLAATEAAGGQVVLYDRYRGRRESIATEIAARDGRVLIRPYDDHRVMAGQGTTALEVIEEVDDLDELWVCVGGGGLLAGCVTVARALRPEMRIVGVEPEAGDDHRQSAMAGERVEIAVPRTIADGQQVSMPGELTWPITAPGTDEWVTVSDDQIVATMRLLFDEAHMVVEPSGASALAAVLYGGHDLTGRRLAVTLSGGNISLGRFSELMSRLG
jgi:threo-3-hydroxy-L-aspartate ammonia-lyase